MLVLATTSCGGGKKKIDPFETLTSEIDSLSAAPDTMVIDTAPVRPEVIPATADESFADFFYNFASNERFQHSRVMFPLSFYKGKNVARIAKDEWKYDPLFSRDLVYTVLLIRKRKWNWRKIRLYGVCKWTGFI